MTSTKHSKGIKIFMGLLAMGFILLIALMSFYAGKLYTNRSNASLIRSINDLLPLTPILKNSSIKPEEVLGVYESKVNAGDLDTFSYDIPKVPTPFVVSAPRPGRFGNAYISQQQFRYDKELETPKPSNVYRIFVTGGSVAYGGGAPGNKKTISGIMETMLNDSLSLITKKKFEVINAACPAWCSTQERIWIEDYLTDFQPDIIISFSGNNDAHWSKDGNNTLFFRTYWDHFLNMLTQNVYSATGNGNYPEILPGNGKRIASDLVAERLQRNVLLATTMAKQYHFEYFFVLQPNLLSTSREMTAYENSWLNKWEKGDLEYFRDCYKEIAKSLNKVDFNNFQYIDQSGLFDNVPSDKQIFFDAYHFGDRGNRWVAEDLVKKISPYILGK